MTKQELIKLMSDKAGISQREAGDALEAMIEGITKALKKGDKVQLVGFGTFQIKSRKARTGINPSTNEKIKIPASKVPALKFGKSYRDQFNAKSKK